VPASDLEASGPEVPLGMTRRLGTIVLLSLEQWDQVWRRNQHLSAAIVGLGLADRIVFVCPGVKLRHQRSFDPKPGITVVTPHLVLPQRRGGLGLLARELRARVLRRADILWINDAVLGVRCLRPNLPAVYDVTDDWRSSQMSDERRAELVAAEDVLAGAANTIVCNEVLRDRWRERYGVVAPIVHNGVDTRAYANAAPIELPGSAPHVMYVGTLHRERLDVELLIRIAGSGSIGTLHLVGPDHFDDDSRRQLQSLDNVALHGAIPHLDVPQWMASADVLICPHLVDAFTLSLDAIKSFEYLASGRPILATPTSGFQSLDVYDSLRVVDREQYVETLAVLARERAPTRHDRSLRHDWSIRARDFATILSSASGPRD
jgi:teichuronic acid biosynthesis glycosyltransferase TuaH